MNTLLDFSRIEANRAQAFYEPVNLAALTRDLSSLFRSAVEKAGLSLHVDCPDLPGPVYVDTEMWEKILLNLLSNAFKFTFRGSITVTLRQSATEASLFVRDTGAGIPPKELGSVFKRFHRVQGARGRTHEGTGIGLALVEELVKLHGGRVWAESEVGVGTTFYVVLPMGFRHLSPEHVRHTEAGADDYLVKPFNARELVARVRVNLELAHLRQELSREDERRRSVEEIEKQWRVFDTALSHTPDAIYMFDLNGRLTYANRALLDRWQKSLSDVTGKSLPELGYGDEIAARLEDQMREVIRTGSPLRDQTSLVDVSGVVRHYDYVFMPVLTPDGVVELVAGSTRDVTEFNETNRALRDANEDLQQFAYSASHDLQEPLRMVAIYSQLLQKRYGNRLDAQADLIIKQCVDGALRMEHLIRDLLAYTRASTRPILPAQDTSLERVFEAILQSLQAAVIEANATVTRSPLPALKVDAAHLHPILQNLIGNAIKYRSAEPALVHVSARRKGQEWIISVADNGIGISPEYREQVFGLFKRLNDRTQYAGTGLGLAICKKLVERYGGRIWVESELARALPSR